MNDQPPKQWEDLPAEIREQWAHLMAELTLPPLSLGLGITTAKLAKLDPGEVAADPELDTTSWRGKSLLPTSPCRQAGRTDGLPYIQTAPDIGCQQHMPVELE